MKSLYYFYKVKLRKQQPKHTKLLLANCISKEKPKMSDKQKHTAKHSHRGPKQIKARTDTKQIKEKEPCDVNVFIEYPTKENGISLFL